MDELAGYDLVHDRLANTIDVIQNVIIPKSYYFYPLLFQI